MPGQRALDCAGDQTLVRLRKAQVRRGSFPILEDIDFCLRRGEDWLVTGKNGAGKSSFLRLVRGDLWPLAGTGKKPRLYFANGQTSVSPITFREKTGWVAPELLNRYQSMQWDMSVLEVLISGLYQTTLLYQTVRTRDVEHAKQTAEQFKIKSLLSQQFCRLSQGEAQKVLLARALINSPEVVFLDEIGPSLDQRAKGEIRDILSQARSGGTQLIVVAHDPDAITQEIAKAVILEKGRVLFQGSKSKWPIRARGRSSVLETTRMETHGFKKRGVLFRSGSRHLVQAPGTKEGNRSPALSMEGVRVRIQGQTILDNFSWRVNPGEHWGLVGANGSGKSTLLRLILGEIHPLPGGRIIRFGQNERVSIWWLKQQIGFFSPLLQSWHTTRQTVLETVVSGFWGHLGSHVPIQAEQEETALAWLERFSMAGLQDRDIQTLSHGQLRKALLVRAVVHSPKMVLLDEPCAGLDHHNRERFLSFIARLAETKTQVIMATHQEADFIPAIDNILQLEPCRGSV